MKYISQINESFVKEFILNNMESLVEDVDIKKFENKIVAMCQTDNGMTLKMRFEDFKINERWCPEWINSAWQTKMSDKFGEEYSQDLKQFKQNDLEKSFMD